MNLYKSPTYLQDLDDTISKTNLLSAFHDKSVFITGAGGLICSAIVDLLLRYNERSSESIHVYVGGRKESSILNRFSRYKDSSRLHFIPYDASTPNLFDFHVDYIIHGASNASPAKIQEKPVETMLDNFCGLHELLTYATAQNVQNTVFISSSEIYGTRQFRTDKPFHENEYGFIDLLNPRSSYSVGKRAAETLCASYAYEKNLSVSIVRPGHIYGPTAKKDDNRVASVFAYDASAGKPLVLKSDGSQLRSYCYILDCATAILAVLLRGNRAAAYNISNPNSIISIRTLAELYARYGNVDLVFDLPTEKEQKAFNPMANSSLDSTFLESLGWTPLFDAATGTEHTIKILQEAHEKTDRLMF